MANNSPNENSKEKQSIQSEHQHDKIARAALDKEIQQHHSERQKKADQAEIFVRSIKNEYAQAVEKEFGASAVGSMRRLLAERKITRRMSNVDPKVFKAETISLVQGLGIKPDRLKRIRQDYGKRIEKIPLILENQIHSTTSNQGGGGGGSSVRQRTQPALWMTDQHELNVGSGHLYNVDNIRPYDNNKAFERDIFNDYTFFNTDAGDFDFTYFESDLRVGCMAAAKVGECLTVEVVPKCEKTLLRWKFDDEYGLSGCLMDNVLTHLRICVGSTLRDYVLWGIDMNSAPGVTQTEDRMNFEPLRPGPITIYRPDLPGYDGPTFHSEPFIVPNMGGSSGNPWQSIPVWVGIYQTVKIMQDDVSIILHSVNRFNIQEVNIFRQPA